MSKANKGFDLFMELTEFNVTLLRRDTPLNYISGESEEIEKLMEHLKENGFSDDSAVFDSTFGTEKKNETAGLAVYYTDPQNVCRGFLRLGADDLARVA